MINIKLLILKIKRSELERIKKTAGWLSLIMGIVAVIYPIGVLVGIALTGLVEGINTSLPVTLTSDEWTLGLRAAVALVSLPSMAAGVYIAVKLKELFDSYKAGELFTIQQSHSLLRAAQGAVAYTCLTIVEKTIQSVVLSWHYGEGNRFIQVGISTDHVVQILVALLILHLSWIQAEAARLKSEAELTI